MPISASGAGACAPERQALRQSDVWRTGYRQFQFHSRILEAAARCGRRGARNAGAGGSATMAGRSGELLDVDGNVIHAASGRTLGYGDLWMRASALPVPQDPPLKDPKDFTLIGKPLKRLDTPDKTDGKAVYGIDAMLPGMKFATLASMSGIRRQSRPCRRQHGQEDTRRAPGRGAGRSGRGCRRSHVGGQKRARRSRDHLERRRNAKVNSSDIWDDIATPAKRTAWWQRLSATSPRACSQGDNSRPNMNCRSWRTRPWSR